MSHVWNTPYLTVERSISTPVAGNRHLAAKQRYDAEVAHSWTLAPTPGGKKEPAEWAAAIFGQGTSESRTS